jgi:hypothetical protein
MLIDFHAEVTARQRHCLAGSHDSADLSSHGDCRVWLTFQSDGWHFDSCLGNCRNFEEGESEEEVSVL